MSTAKTKSTTRNNEESSPEIKQNQVIINGPEPMKPDSLRDLSTKNFASAKSWDLSWYECLIAFEDKKRVNVLPEEFARMNAEETAVQVNQTAPKTNVFIPLSVMRQLEAVKFQITEFLTILELNEKMRRENEKIQEKVDKLQQISDYMKNKFECSRQKKEEKANKLETQYMKTMKQNKEIKQKIMALRKEKRKRLREITILRQIYKPEDSSPKSFKEIDKSRRNSDSALRSSRSSRSSTATASSSRDRKFFANNLKDVDEEEDDADSSSSDASLQLNDFEKSNSNLSLKGTLQQSTSNFFKMFKTFAEEADFSMVGNFSTAW